MVNVQEPSNSRPIRILVADDHPVVRAGFKTLLGAEENLIVVAEASNGTEAIKAWEKHRPDIGLIDLNMPSIDGFDCIRHIKAADAQSRLVAMTVLGGDCAVYEALKAGASGYLLKDCEPKELLACIKNIYEGKVYLQPAAASSLAQRVTHVELTLREAEVMSLLVEGLSNKLIARQLSVEEGTIKTHVKAILSKLHATSRTQAVCYALQRGLVHTSLPPVPHNLRDKFSLWS
jgi:two-component system, NarL family, response regulator